MQKFFDHIYILNLDKRSDRWAAIQKQLERTDITKAKRFSAIEKSPGWVGCYESHLAILQRALSENARNILVLEDDAELYADWMPNWVAASREIPIDWDMIYLGFNLNPEANLPPPRVAPHILLLNDALTTHAYAVNGKYLQPLIECVKAHIGNNLPIDVVYSRQFDHIKAYGLYPMLFYQSPGFSDILGCKTDFHFRQNVDHVLNK